MRYIVVASGGVGCLWAAVLAQNENNKVVIVHHRTTFIDTIKRQRGILLKVIEKSRNRQNELVNLEPFSNLEEAIIYHGHEVDCIVFMVKVHNTVRVVKSLKKETLKKIKDFGTVMITLQTPLANVEIMEKYFNKPYILYGTTLTHAVSSQDGIVEGSPHRPTSLWSASNSLNEKSKVVIKNLSTSNLATTATKDAELILWKKLAVNCAINSVTSITLLKVRPSCTESGGIGKDIMREIAAEVAKVAQEEGISLSEKEAIDSLDFVTRKAGNHVSAMCNDVLNRRQTEIENMNGYVIRCAEKHHIDVPMLRSARMFIRLIQDTYSLQLQPVQGGLK